MSPSIVLDNPESVWIDEGEDYLAIFCRTTPVAAGRELLSELKKVAEKVNSKNVRLCMHDSPGAGLHDMIILAQKERYYRPHKHPAKDESFHLIEGSMAVFTFDEKGRVVDTCLMEEQGDFLFRIAKGIYHSIMPLTDFAIYHESKPGPFTGKEENHYALWAPDGKSADKTNEYKGRLMNLLKAKR